tara:strand:- start:663 stop:803 length:141 start_codon:yes stop_codon:yes gene_type:complete
VKNEFLVKLDKNIIDKLNIIASREKIDLDDLIETILERSLPETIDK